MSETELPPAEDNLFDSAKPRARGKVEYFAETVFDGADLTRSVHLGWGAMLGALSIFLCMGASAATQ
ncbi:uncharacterized protein HaLaN_01673, partial [Haematococcus lacustris]